MATVASRSRALSVYRKLLRSARTWPGPESEKQYILSSYEDHQERIGKECQCGKRVPAFPPVVITLWHCILIDKASEKEETRAQFRLHQHNKNPEEINHKIFEGESRHDIGWDYKIPYPRLHNFPTGTVTETPSRIAGPRFEIPSDEMASLDDRKTSEFKGGWENLVLRS